MENGKETPQQSSAFRVQKCRESKSVEEKQKVKEKDILRKAKNFAKMTEEEKQLLREKNRQRMAKKREIERREKKEEKEREMIRQQNDKFFQEREHEKEYKRKVRQNMKAPEKEFKRIEQLMRNRRARGERNGKDHLLDNLDAKRGMQDLKELGRLLKCEHRYYYKKSEMEIWKIFYDLGTEYKEILKEKKEEVFQKIVEEEEKKMEEEKRKKNPDYDAIQEAIKAGHWGTGEKEGYIWIEKSYGRDWFWARDTEEPKKGEWVFRGGDYFWEGEGDPPEEADPNMDTNQFNWTEEDERRYKEQKEEEIKMTMETMKRMAKEDKEERKREEESKRVQKKKDLAEYMKSYREKKRAALMNPIKMPKVSEKSEYLLLQEKNIAELEERKKASGLFDD